MGTIGIPVQGIVDSPAISGEAQFAVTDKGLLISALFERILLPYADMDSFTLKDYSVCIWTGGCCYTITRLERACDWFYRELYTAYNKCTLKAFAVEGAPVMETRGIFEIRESPDTVSRHADIRIYRDCLCAMTSDTYTRRIPLLFINGISEGDYSFMVSLSTGEQYTFSKLGHDTEAFAHQTAAQITAFRENAAMLVKEQNPDLKSGEISEAVKLFPNGTAAPLIQMYSILPSYAKTIDRHITDSRIVGTCGLLKEVGVASKFCAGAKFTAVAEGNVPIVWAVAFNGKGDTAAVELALPDEESAATYIYHTDGNDAGFLDMLNRALEATGFRREAVSLPEEELDKDQYALYRILLARTPWLRKLRKAFMGRVVHSSPERWEKGIRNYFD